jgi:hypothetical protein
MEHFAYGMGQARSHLDTGALSAERQPRADGQQSTEELHGDQIKRSLRKLAPQDGFDLRDAASRRVRRVPTDHPSGKRSRACANGENEKEADSPEAMSPSSQPVAQKVRLFERKPEDRTNESRKRAREQRKQRKRQ